MRLRNLSVLCYANGFTLWAYKDSSDLLATVTSPHFLGDAADMLSVGDMVLLAAADGGTVRMVAHIQHGTQPHVLTVPLS